MAKEKASKRGKTTVVRVDRRKPGDRRIENDRRQNDACIAQERRVSERRTNRRRQIDPTTCERDYTAAEVEFMHALDAYKRVSGRMFPTCSEILEVVQSLGYHKRDQDVVVAPPTESQPTIERELEAALGQHC